MTETHYLDTKQVELRCLEMENKGMTLKSRKDFPSGRSRLVFVEIK